MGMTSYLLLRLVFQGKAPSITFPLSRETFERLYGEMDYAALKLIEPFSK